MLVDLKSRKLIRHPIPRLFSSTSFPPYVNSLCPSSTRSSGLSRKSRIFAPLISRHHYSYTARMYSGPPRLTPTHRLRRDRQFRTDPVIALARLFSSSPTSLSTSLMQNKMVRSDKPEQGHSEVALSLLSQ